MPSLACIDRSSSASMIPSSAAVADVIMKSAIFVRATGTPMLRAATGSPPAPKIQLPNRVRGEHPGADDREADPPERP